MSNFFDPKAMRPREVLARLILRLPVRDGEDYHVENYLRDVPLPTPLPCPGDTLFGYMCNMPKDILAPFDPAGCDHRMYDFLLSVQSRVYDYKAGRWVILCHLKSAAFVSLPMTNRVGVTGTVDEEWAGKHLPKAVWRKLPACTVEDDDEAEGSPAGFEDN